MKIKEFRGMLEKKNLDAAIFYNSEFPRINPNMAYFSGYTGLGVLVVPQRKEPFLITPEMEFQKAKKSMIKKVFSMQKKRFFESVSDIIRKNGIKTKNIAIDRNNFTLNSFKYFRKSFRKSKFKDVALNCIKLREIKTNKEIEYLKKSCDYADKIIQKTIKNFKDFKTESGAAAFLEYATKKLGLELSFNPIVASGSNGSMPHHEPKNERIKNGLCVIDFGVKYKGYCSDITRTIYVGKQKKEEIDMYNLLLKIQNDTINEVKENKKCSELYDFVNKNLGKYKKYFTHGLGHGVGIEIHEMPNLSLNSKDRIQNNMAFTIEPGVYFPKKFGIRIEDTLMFKDKPTVLTKTSKNLLII
ncbi:MAG: Xaa-Pro peptidase family protein [Nanoarchaeota archaeon]